MESILEIRNLTKKYQKFTLGEINTDIPRGFATALIGANGAGKTTFLDAVSGISRPTSGSVRYFGKTKDVDLDMVRNAIGYCSASGFFPLAWDVRHIANAMELGFDNFSPEKFDALCAEFKLDLRSDKKRRTIQKMSDGNRTRTALAAVFARDTELLVLDEPASSLDPLMRDTLCEKFREYLAENESRAILFSTHNIADMETATDFAIFMHGGKVVEMGFVEDLKDKYMLIHGNASDIEKARPYMFTLSGNKTAFEGCALAKNAAELSKLDIEAERPTLQQLSVAVLKRAETEA